MTDDQQDEGSRLGDVLDSIVGSMTREQFEQLAQRTGHREVEPKQKAKDALAQLLEQDNVAADGRTFGEVRDRLARRRNI